MQYDPHLQCRHSIRMQGYDYSQEGAYFATLCTQGRTFLFGNIQDGRMHLNDAGRLIDSWFLELHRKYHSWHSDEYVIMPNHIHFILICSNATSERAGIQCDNASPTLCSIIQWFKTMTTNEYIRNVKQKGWTPFSGKLWQRNYYEHVIRNEKGLDKIREYIVMNPERWEWDEDNPERKHQAQGHLEKSNISIHLH